MKQIFFGLVACVALATALPAYSADDGQPAMQDPRAQQEKWKGQDLVPPAMHNSSRCQDDMETIPDNDDLDPTPVALDAACKVADRPLGT